MNEELDKLVRLSEEAGGYEELSDAELIADEKLTQGKRLMREGKYEEAVRVLRDVVGDKEREHVEAESKARER